MADHTHDSYDVYDVAREHHQHYDLDNRMDGLRADLNGAYERIRELEDTIEALTETVNRLEGT